MHIRIFNYTPHEVTLLRADNTVIDRFDSIGVARCKEIATPMPSIPYDAIDAAYLIEAPIVSKRFGAVEGLPPVDPARMYMYIVSQIVADSCPNRADLLVPSETVRDAAGQVIGCRSLSRRFV